MSPDQGVQEHHRIGLEIDELDGLCFNKENWGNFYPQELVENLREHLEFKPHDTIIDPLIEPVVRVLQENNIHTVESCQATPGHFAYETRGGFPWIKFKGTHADGYRAYALMLERTWPVHSLSRKWMAHYQTKELEGPEWEISFGPLCSRRLPQA